MLAQLVKTTQAELSQRKNNVAVSTLEAQIAQQDRTASFFSDALATERLSLIAEFKRSSPNIKSINLEAAPQDYALEYERGGAGAISVLTSSAFNGSLADLSIMREHCQLPLLCKEIILDPYQIYEAAAAGANAILLIARLLELKQLQQLQQLSTELAMGTLLEVHNREELSWVQQLDLDPNHLFLGINNRDLDTGEVDLSKASELIEDVSLPVSVIAESGYSNADELEQLQNSGFAAVLIGTSLMRSQNRPLRKQVKDLVYRR